MRVEDGYKPKQKFSVTLTPEIFDRLDAYCKGEGIHRTSFIEEAVRRALEDKGGIRAKVHPGKNKKRSASKQDIRLLAKGRST